MAVLYLAFFLSATVSISLGQKIPADVPNLHLTTSGEIHSIVILNGTNIFVGGRFTEINGVPRRNLALLVNGVVDASWDMPVDGPVHALAVANSSLYIGGEFSNVAGAARTNLAKISVAGTLDASWAPPVSGSVQVLASDSSNLYVGGAFFQVGGASHTNLARVSLTGNGAPDAGWNPNPNGIVSALRIESGNLYAGGEFTALGGVNRSRLAKISISSGAVDSQFRPDPNQPVRAIYIDSSNLYAGGEFTSIGGKPFTYFARVSTSDGSAESSTPQVNGPVYCLAPGSANTLVIGGQFTSSSPACTNLIRLDMKKDKFTSGWNANVQETVTALAVGAKATYAGGKFRFVEGGVRPGLAAFNSTSGRQDTNYFNGSVTLPGKVNALARQSDGKVIFAGDFVYAGSQIRMNLARLDNTYALDNSWSPLVNGEVRSVVLNGTDIYIGGAFSQVSGVARSGIARLSTTNTVPDSSWNPSIAPAAPASGVFALLVHSNQLFAAGSFTTVTGISHPNIVRLPLTGAGAADSGWAASANGPVLCLLGDGNTIYAGGKFSSANGTALSNLARFSRTDGSLDPTWLPNPGDEVDSLALVGTTLTVGGAFQVIASQAVNGFAGISISAPVAIAGDWHTKLGGTVRALRAGSNLLYAGGLFEIPGDGGHTNLVRFAANATVDASWQHRADGTVTDFLLSGQDAVIGGEFLTVGGLPREGVAFLPVADAPVMFTGQTNLFYLNRSSSDGPEAGYFQVTGISGGSVYLHDGATQVPVNGFITVAQGAEGLQFVVSGTPATRSVTAKSAIAPSAEGVGTASTTLNLSVGSLPVIQFSQSQQTNSEGLPNAVITITKSGGGAASIQYATADGSALAGSDYTATNGVVNFADQDTSKTIQVTLLNDTLAEGDETFAVVLSSPTQAVLASPSTITIHIQDNDALGNTGSFLTNALPSSPLPQSDGVLQIFLDPPGASGQWRIAGDLRWHDSGETVTGLTSADYDVEFKPVTGYSEPPAQTVTMVAGETNAFTALYTSVSPSGVGDLTVAILPQSVASNTDVSARGQWRRQGETSWHDSQERVSGLNSGKYLIEFKPLSGWASPPQVVIVVNAGQLNSVSALYQVATVSSAQAPVPLSFSTATGSQPFLYNGQIQSELGFGSGVVVKEKVVLTAAHLLFDDVKLSYVSGARWFFNRHSGTYEPVPLVPRGWFVFSGYASQRTADASPGVSSAASQNLDAAALYFKDPAGRGGFGGFLASDQVPNPWVVSTRPKILAGYPIDGIPTLDQGILHATPAGRYGFAHLYESVYSTTEIRSYPGNSGGPLYVQADDGQYYPAAIYLGGSAQTIVRSIDTTVVDLINRAELAANGGDNFVGGGVSLLSSELSAPLFDPGFVSVLLSPKSAVDAGAGWRVAGTQGSYISDNTTKLSLPPGKYTIEFQTVGGYQQPKSADVQITADQVTTIPGDYLLSGNPPLITTPPASLVVTQGNPASFSVVATGSDPLGYQWRRNSANIAGATNASFNIGLTQASDAGDYSVLVYNFAGSITSAVATLTVKPGNNAPVAVGQTLSTPEDTGLSISLTGTDVEGSSLTFSIVQPPAHGSFSGTLPNVTFHPDANFSGTDSFQFIVNDGQLDSAPAQVDLTITAVNDPPVIDTLTDRTVSEDSTLGPIAFSISDLETAAGSLGVSAVSDNPTLIPNSAIQLGGSGGSRTMTLTPARDQFGSAKITVTVTDGGQSSASSSFIVQVTAVNDAPVANALSATVAQNGSYALLLTGSDADKDALSYQISQLPAHGSLTGTPPRVTYTPAPDYNGSDTFQFKVSDGNLDSAAATVSLNVIPVSGTPSISSIADQDTNEDTAVQDIPFTISDPGTAADDLVLAVASSDTNLVSASGLTLGGSGQNRTLTVTPVTNQFGTVTISITVTNAEGAAASTSFDLVIHSVNDPPIAYDQTVQLSEDNSANFTLTGSDLEGGTLSFIFLTLPTHGSIKGTAPNLTYTPDANYNGSDQFTFQVSDGTNNSTAGTVSLQIAAMPDAPVISSIADQTTAEDHPVGPLAFTVQDIETTASQLTVAAASSNPVLLPAANILLTGTGTNRTLTLVPARNATGTATVSLSVTDTDGTSSSRSFVLTVTPENDPPSAAPLSITTDEDSPVAMTLAGSDIENSPLTFELLSNPAHGTLSGNIPNLIYTPVSNYFGTDSFSFRVNDGGLDSASALVRITINSVNDLPTITGVQDQQMNVNGVRSFTVLIGDVETPAGLLTLSAASSDESLIAPSGVAMAGSGAERTVTLHPVEDATGEADVTLSVSDGIDTFSEVFHLVVDDYEPVRLTYYGLFFPDSAMDPTNSGAINLRTDSLGGFSGRLELQGRGLPFRGKIAPSGTSQVQVARRNASALTLDLDFSFGADGIVGNVTDGGFSSPVVAFRGPVSTTSTTRNYTFLIPGTDQTGTGYGRMIARTSGQVQLSGALPDGTPLSRVTSSVVGGLIPFYQAPYGSTGMVIGWLRFVTDDPAADLSGTLRWFRPAGYRPPFLPNGIQAPLTLKGSLYSAPAGTALLDWTDGEIQLTGGNLDNPIAQDIDLTPGNERLLAARTNTVTMTITRSTGLMRGRFKHPGNGLFREYRGAILQKTSEGGGYFLGTDAVGTATVAPK